MSKQSNQHRNQQRVKSTVPVDNGAKRPAKRTPAIWEGRFVIRSNHAKVGMKHFS